MTQTRSTTWRNLGTDISTCKNVNEVLEAAKLNYTVETEKLITESGIVLPGHVATMATIDGERTILGHVSNKYQICQNNEAFDFVDSISDELTFERAGMTQGGMVYVIGKLNPIEVLGDTITPYVILQNGHNGRFSLRTTICPLRMVCQNQFNMAFKESPNTITIMHSSQMPARIENAKRLLTGAAAHMASFNEMANEYAEIKLGKNANEIIDAFFKLGLKGNETEKRLENLDLQARRLKNIYEAEDNQNFKGTMWGLVNAYSDFITHKDIKEDVAAAERQFLTVTFDPRVMQSFMEFAMEKVA